MLIRLVGDGVGLAVLRLDPIMEGRNDIGNQSAGNHEKTHGIVEKHRTYNLAIVNEVADLRVVD